MIAYHDRTKHHPERYARGPGGLDWATQPDPFRRFNGSPMLKLPLADRDNTPAAAILFGVGVTSPQPFTLDALGLFFELSMGLSARKEIPGMSWYLRIILPAVICIRPKPMPSCPRGNGCRAARVFITTHRWLTPWSNGRADRRVPDRKRPDFMWD